MEIRARVAVALARSPMVAYFLVLVRVGLRRPAQSIEDPLASASFYIHLASDF